MSEKKIELKSDNKFDIEYRKSAYEEIYSKHPVTEKVRSIIEMRLDGFSNKDIAEALDMHPVSISKNLNTDIAKKIMSELRALNFITRQEKIEYAMNIALDENIKLLTDEDKRIRHKAIDAQIKFFTIANPNNNNANVSVTNAPNIEDLGL